MISNTSEFEQTLPSLCEEVVRHLGAQNLESSYQKALKYELVNAGVEVLSEVKLNVMYKDVIVGTRRADLVLKLKDNTRIVIELKAVKHLSGENMEQLYYYMAHLRCNVGYLINFPHETGFPNVLDVGIATGSIRVANYEHKIENIGDEKKLSPVIYKALNMTIQEIKDERDERDETIEIVNDLAKLDIAKPSPRKPTVKGGKAVAPSVSNTTSSPTVKKGPVIPHSAANATVFVAPIASSTKQPCKVCTGKGELCRMHRVQG